MKQWACSWIYRILIQFLRRVRKSWKFMGWLIYWSTTLEWVPAAVLRRLHWRWIYSWWKQIISLQWLWLKVLETHQNSRKVPQAIYANRLSRLDLIQKSDLSSGKFIVLNSWDAFEWKMRSQKPKHFTIFCWNSMDFSDVATKNFGDWPFRLPPTDPAQETPSAKNNTRGWI